MGTILISFTYLLKNGSVPQYKIPVLGSNYFAFRDRVPSMKNSKELLSLSIVYTYSLNITV
jgi:hypothetical protein